MVPAIEIQSVVKYFKSLSRKVLALDAVNLSVAQGEVFGFLGPNGAGKTTLIKIMMGMLHPDSGAVRVMGESPFEPKSKRRLGYLPERPYFHDFVTGEEFLRFHGRLFCLDRELIEKRIPEVLAAVDLERGRKLELKRYSKGMLQRIGLAQALLHDPDVLVLDEPMSGLDPVGRKEVRDLIAGIAKTGKTVFFSTHIVSDIEAVCTNVGFVNKGRLKSIDNLDEALGRTLKSVEIRFSLPAGARPAFLSRKGAVQAADGWVINLAVPDASSIAAVEAEAGTLIEAVIHEKGTVKSVIPRKGNLEELFFEDSR